MALMTGKERESFLAERRAGIGGSDSAAAMGLNPYKPALQLWGEKTGLLEEPDVDAKGQFAEWGNRLEDVIAEAYTDKTGRKVRRRRRQLRHKDHPWMTAHLDRDVWDDKLGKGVLQIKTTSARLFKNWQDDSLTDVLHYDIQLQHEMHVAGAEWGAFAVLVGGNHMLHDLDYPHLFRRPNPDFVDFMVSTEKEFWDCVTTKTEPGLSNLGDDAAALLALHEPDMVRETPVFFSKKQREQWFLIHKLKADKSELVDKIERIENAIKQQLGNSNQGIFLEGDGYTWNSSFPRRVRSTAAMRETYEKLARAHPRLSFKKIFPDVDVWIQTLTSVSAVRTLLYKKIPGAVVETKSKTAKALARNRGKKTARKVKGRPVKKKTRTRKLSRAPKPGTLKRAPKK